jgi:hypothetical protein
MSRHACNVNHTLANQFKVKSGLVQSVAHLKARVGHHSLLRKHDSRRADDMLRDIRIDDQRRALM